MRSVYGIVFDKDGLAANGHAAWATPAAKVRGTQPNPLIIDRDHDHVEHGRITHLELRHGSLWAVGELEDSFSPTVPVRVGTELRHVATPFYWSAERIGAADSMGFELLAISLTASPARISARPVKILDGNNHMAAYTTPDSWERGLLERAYEAKLTRHNGPIVVHDETPMEHACSMHSRALRPGPIEIRSTPELVDVEESRRQIDLIVIPYERDALVEHHGRLVHEVCSRSAFVGAERDTDRIRVNRDHRRERTVGRALLLDPGDPRGLFASLRIARTALGDETLALASEDCLDASAGFGVMPGGEHWEGKSRRRVTKAWLDHIALTPDPAYHDAKVLAVREGLR